MSEYICECDEYRSSWGETYRWAAEYKEPIIRCKDCKYMSDDGSTTAWCGENCREVRPRDFCAWGVRRDA